MVDLPVMIGLVNVAFWLKKYLLEALKEFDHNLWNERNSTIGIALVRWL